MDVRSRTIRASEAGIAVHTLRRVKDKLGIKPRKDGFSGGCWIWALPVHNDETDDMAPKMPNSVEDAHTNDVGTFGAKGHLRAADPLLSLAISGTGLSLEQARAVFTDEDHALIVSGDMTFEAVQHAIEMTLSAPNNGTYLIERP